MGLIKQRTTAYLMHAQLPLKFWYWAAKQAAYIYRAEALKQKLPADAPTFLGIGY